jgi:hypothetical protein
LLPRFFITDSLPNFASGLEVAQKNDRIRQIAGIHRRIHLRADEPLLRPVRIVATLFWLSTSAARATEWSETSSGVAFRYPFRLSMMMTLACRDSTARRIAW